MSTTQRYCLRWNNHQSNLLTVFDQLLHDGSFVDVTLAVEGQYLKAHKMVLSACSPYFQTLFINHPDKHPIVILKDVPYCDMRCLLDFMYRGEVSVDQDRLTAFLRIAETLRIKGLTQVNESESLYNHQQPQQNNLNPPNLHRISQFSNNNNNNNNQTNNKIQNSQKATDQQQQTSNNNSYLSNTSSSIHQKRKRGRPRKLSGGSGEGTPSQSACSPVDDLENRLSGGDQEESIDYEGSLVKSELNNSQPMAEDDNENDEEMIIQNIKQEPIAGTSKDTIDGSFGSINDQQFTSNNNNNQSELIYCLELSGNINSPINISQQTCSEICESVIISADEFTRQQQQLRQDSVIKTLSLDILQSEATIVQSEPTLSYSNKRDSEFDNEASTSKRFRTRKEQPTIIDVFTETSEDEMLSSDSSFHLSDTDFENEDSNDDDVFNESIIKKTNKSETQGDNNTNTNTNTTDIVVENFISQNSVYGIRDKKDLLKYKTLEDGSVICKLCNKKFDSRTQWYRHKYKAHNESETIITVQPVSLDNLNGISSQDSERALSISALFKCDKCQVFYKSRRGYLGHINRRHKNNKNVNQLLSSNTSSDNEFDKSYSEVNKQLVQKCRQKGYNISFQKPNESEKQRKNEEKIINDIIERVRKECEEQGLPTK